MLLTLVCEIDGNIHPITFSGTADDCQNQANGFIGDGVTVNRIILFGDKR